MARHRDTLGFYGTITNLFRSAPAGRHRAGHVTAVPVRGHGDPYADMSRRSAGRTVNPAWYARETHFTPRRSGGLFGRPGMAA